MEVALEFFWVVYMILLGVCNIIVQLLFNQQFDTESPS